MSRIVLFVLFIIIYQSNTYAQIDTLKSICQKWQIDTLVLREAVLKDLTKEHPEADTKIAEVAASSIMRAMIKLRLEINSDGTCTVFSAKGGEKGTWRINQKDKLLLIQCLEQKVEFIIYELRQNYLIISDKNFEGGNEHPLNKLPFIVN